MFLLAGRWQRPWELRWVQDAVHSGTLRDRCARLNKGNFHGATSAPQQLSPEAQMGAGTCVQGIHCQVGQDEKGTSPVAGSNNIKFRATSFF